MQEARAWFVVFLAKNAMAPINDTTVEYLDMLIQDELTKIEAGKKLGLPFDKNRRFLRLFARTDRHISISSKPSSKTPTKSKTTNS